MVAHLRACADVWMFSIYAMLAEDEPALPDLDERKWAKVTAYTELEFYDLLQVYALQRAELINVLRDLPTESWARSATIAGRKHTVFSQVRRMALHEVEHCEQIEQSLTC